MSSVKGKLLRLGSGLLRRASVVECLEVGAGFRRITLRGDAPRPAAGTKLQLLLPSDDVRTYSPIASRDEGAIVLLGWMHAGGPGARWVAEVAVGSEVHFAGPQRSLDLPKGAVVIVGDETSVAVAASYAAERRGQVHAILQGSSPEGLREAAESVGLRPAHVAARGDTNGLVEAIVAAHVSAPHAAVGLTGGSELIVAVRAALRSRGIRDIKTKAYWIPGKTGLD
jgi:NADPH-dependent ferric siderophore reductase